MKKESRFLARGISSILILMLVLLLFTACGSVSGDSVSDVKKENDVQEVQKAPEIGEEKKVEEVPVEKPEESLSQKNAVRSAKSYLDFSAFSRSGLIGQLEFEGFSNEDATYAVDQISPNWKEQAVKSAGSYLEFSAFSRSGLIDQLIFEGFSEEDATYAVDQIGL